MHCTAWSVLTHPELCLCLRSPQSTSQWVTAAPKRRRREKCHFVKMPLNSSQKKKKIWFLTVHFKQNAFAARESIKRIFFCSGKNEFYSFFSADEGKIIIVSDRKYNITHLLNRKAWVRPQLYLCPFYLHLLLVSICFLLVKCVFRLKNIQVKNHKQALKLLYHSSCTSLHLFWSHIKVRSRKTPRSQIKCPQRFFNKLHTCVSPPKALL